MYKALMTDRAHRIGNQIDKLMEKKEKPMKTTRLEKWIKAEKEAGATEYELICGITHGNINTPDWIGYTAFSLCTLTVWDEDDMKRDILLVDDREEFRLDD